MNPAPVSLPVRAMRACPRPIVTAVNGVCVGAGAIVVMASGPRIGTALAEVAFLFNCVGLAGCNRLPEPEALLAEAAARADQVARGPTFANGITKTILHQEWSISVDQAIEAMVICMAAGDVPRAFA